jgi:hypothetical protein
MPSSNPRAIGSALSAIGKLLTQPIGSSSRGTPRRVAAERPSSSVGHRQMRRELYTLLERHPASRQTMRHLDVVERLLRRDSIDAVLALPVKVLARALDEMEALVWDWSQPGLAEVRSRLAVTVKARRNEPVTESKLQERYSTAPPIEADVTEVSHDVYEEMERSWTGQMPADVAAALQAHQAANVPAAAPGASDSRH